ncbi:MAG: hypothetical protein E6G94_00410 [Alphaproteobacteria bacterium]|nr:MAG: hypothetical protein E6G94_00410 [Alphaproteobacteria bacterium]
MAETPLVTLSVALCFALVHVLGKYLRFLQKTPRSIWLSLSGGVSLAYVFVHVLPELAQKQEESLRHLSADEGGALGLHVYLTALAGLVLFYGLDRMVRSAHGGRGKAGPGKPHPRAPVFWVHLGAYAIYSALIGYLLVHREEADTRGLIIYGVALGLHFVVNDQGLRQDHGRAYDDKGRWILAAAPLLGWAAGLAVAVSAVAVASIFAFLAGGILLNVLKEELPEDRESRYWRSGSAPSSSRCS